MMAESSSRFDSDFIKDDILKSVANVTVWKATNKIDMKNYAVKQIQFIGDLSLKIQREVDILARLNHPNIVRYHCCWTEIQTQIFSDSSRNEMMFLYYVMEFCTDGNLSQWLSIHRQITQKETIIQMFTQLATGVAYLHNENIIHRDLKPTNIYVTKEREKNWKIKIGDLGLAKEIISNNYGNKNSLDVDDMHSNIFETRLYWSPELKKSEPYNQSVDIFALGLIYFEMLNEETISEHDKKLLFEQLEEGIFPSSFEESFAKEVEFIRRMLAANPPDRVTVNDILLRFLPYNRRISGNIYAILDQLLQQ